MNNNSTRAIYIDLLLALPLSIIAMFMTIIISQSIQFYNTIISFLSAFLFITAAINIYNYRKIESHNIFLFFFYIGLYFNTFMLSVFQTNKSILDLYYLFIGPLSFYIVLFLFEERKHFEITSKKRFINPDFLYLFFLFFYISIKLYVSNKVGWRISSFDNSNFLQDGSMYVIPGYSGIAMILQWSLIIFSPNAKRKYVIIAIIAIIIFSYLHVKRGDILRVAFFYLILYGFKVIQSARINNRHKNRQNILKVITLTVLLLIIFVYIGNLRESFRGSESDVLANNIGINSAPSFVSWFYGYIPINYDVLKFYYDTSPTNRPTALLNILFSSDENKTEGYSINGFNASTFLRTFIKDFAELYFLEIIIFAIIIGILIMITKKENFFGCYVFILMIISYFFFGNYFESRSIFFSIMFALVIFPYLQIDNRKDLFYT